MSYSFRARSPLDSDKAEPRSLDRDLFIACENGKLQTVESLMAAGADVNARGQNGDTPLIVSAEYDQVIILQTLLNAGADPELKDSSGDTALTTAARAGNGRAVATLLRYVSDASEMNAALFASVESEPTGIVVDSLSPSQHDAAAVQAVAWVDTHASVARLLLSNGASVAARNDEGGDPAHMGRDIRR